MRNVKKMALALVCVLMVGILGGCGSKFDAQAYLKAMLDVSYKNDSTAFVEMKLGTAEEAATVYEQGIDTEMNAFLAGVNVSDELEGEFRELFKDLLSKVKYTVDSAERQDDGSYVVTITYEQMKVYEALVEEYSGIIINLYQSWLADPDSAPTDENEMMEKLIAEPYRDCLRNSLTSVEYAEPATITVRIELVDKVYTPNTSDLEKLEMALIDSEAMNSFDVDEVFNEALE